MIYREILGEMVLEYEGTPEEIILIKRLEDLEDNTKESSGIEEYEQRDAVSFIIDRMGLGLGKKLIIEYGFERAEIEKQVHMGRIIKQILDIEQEYRRQING